MRTFWIIWCCFWAAFWMLLGFFTIVTWILVPFSLLAILLPVGQPRQVTYIQHNQIPPRPPHPSSRFDTRFTEEELRNYYE